jgi:hypothetical protein
MLDYDALKRSRYNPVPKSQLLHCRGCEKVLATPIKTGTIGCVKPASGKRYAELSIAVFGRLIELGGKLATSTAFEPPKEGLLVLESFPTSAWRKIGMSPLPGKANYELKDIEDRINYLRGAYHLKIPRIPSHDELQALVAGLAGLAILIRDESRYQFEGSLPIKQDGHWVEGYIVIPRSVQEAPVPAILRPFKEFEQIIRPALQLEGRRLPLARTIFTLAKEKISQEAAKLTAIKDARRLRGPLVSYDRAWRCVENARKQIDHAQSILGIWPTPEAMALDALRAAENAARPRLHSSVRPSVRTLSKS